MPLSAIPPIVGTLKAVPALSAAGFLWAEGATISLGDKANLAFNVLTIGFVLYVIVRGGKGRVKDQTIKDLQDSTQAKDERNKTLAAELRDAKQQARQIEQAANHCQTEATKWKAKYEEAKQYTSKEAVEHFEEALAKHSGLVAERHAVLIDQGSANAAALSTIASTLATIERKMNGAG
jgi:large-conductance mechanosensitive channel